MKETGSVATDSTTNRIMIGIDPGVTTGIAMWDVGSKEFLSVESMTFMEAIFKIRDMSYCDLQIWFEDARQRKWFGNRNPKEDRARLQGAGSIKRDCQLWEEFCKLHNIPFRMVAPRNIKTKLDKDQFKRITGWMGQTNSHARDAAMLIFQANPTK